MQGAGCGVEPRLVEMHISSQGRVDSVYRGRGYEKLGQWLMRVSVAQGQCSGSAPTSIRRTEKKVLELRTVLQARMRYADINIGAAIVAAGVNRNSKAQNKPRQHRPVEGVTRRFDPDTDSGSEEHEPANCHCDRGSCLDAPHSPAGE